MTNHSAKHVGIMHGISLTIFVILLCFMEWKVYPFIETCVSSDGLSIFISAVIDAFLYLVVYYLVELVYDKVWIPIKHPKYNISGKWYHVHIPMIMGEVDYSRARISAGETDITRNLLDFSFRATNKYFYIVKNESREFKVCADPRLPHTSWASKTTQLVQEGNGDGYDIIELYHVETAGNPMVELNVCPTCRQEFSKPHTVPEAGGTRYGVHKYDLDKKDKDNNGNYYTYIEGTYSDCWPSLKIGQIYLYPTKELRDAKIIEYFNQQSKIANQQQ